MLVLRTSNCQGANIRPKFQDINILLSLLFTTKFSSSCHFKNHVKLFSTFFDERPESQMLSLKKKTIKTHLIQFQLFIFYKPACLRTSTIHILFASDGHYGLILGSLSKPRRRRQRERHETKGLMSKTIAVHVRYKSLYISLPSS